MPDLLRASFGRRLPVSSVHSTGQVLLRVHRVAAGTSLCQPAREARYPSAATLTVSNSPAHASQAGQEQSPRRPGPGKHPRRGQHHPLHTSRGLLCLGRERPETTAPGILTQAHVGGGGGLYPARSRTPWDCKMKATLVVSSVPVSRGSWPQSEAVLTEELGPCFPPKAAPA